MNIGFDAKRAFWNNTGLGNYSRSLISGLITFCPENNYTLFSPGTIIHPDLEPFLKAKNISVKDLGTGISGKIKRVSGFKTTDIDLYHGLSNELPYITDRKTKLIVSIHDLLFLRYPEFYPFIDRKIYKIKTKASCHKADLIIAISNQTKEDLVNFLKIPENKIVVHYQSCHPQFSEFKSQSEITEVLNKYGIRPPYILQVGTLEERKNALLTLKAFSNSKFVSTHQLVLAGRRTAYCNTLETFIKEKGLTHHVKLLYKSSFTDFPCLYQGSSLSVYPSLFEGFGIPVLEAMTSRVPVITSQGGCFYEVGGDAVLYTNPLNEANFTDKINNVLSDTALSANLVALGNSRVKQFEPLFLSTDLNNIYRSVL